MDDELKMEDIPGIKIQESEGNLIITFVERITYEPGDTITIWCAELVEKYKQQANQKAEGKNGD